MKRKGYIISSVVTGLLGEAALAAVVLWLLPLWGVNIPVWGLILLMIAFRVYDRFLSVFLRKPYGGIAAYN